MVDSALLTFAFLQGLVAFFAPCAVALLPGYISHFLTTIVKSDSKKVLLFSALYYGFFTMLGLGLVFGITGILLLLIQEIIKPLVAYITVALGIILIIYGLLLLYGKNVSLNFHGPISKGHPVKQSFYFGIFYAIASLGCLFPLFLGVIAIALQAESVLSSVLYLFAYFLGMGGLLLSMYIAVVFASSYLQKQIVKVLPIVYKISGILLVLGGAYIIYYQGALIL